MATIPRYSGPYGKYGSTPSPGVAAPTNLRSTATTSSTISLAWDGVAGTQTLERAPVDTSTSPATVGTFAPVYTGTPKAYQDTGLTYVTTYDYRAKVTVNGVPSGYSNVVRVTTAASTQPLVFTPQSNEFRFNKRNDTTNAGSGYVYRDALAPWPLSTNAPDLLVRGKTSYGSQYLANACLTVYVDSAFFQRLEFSQAGTEQQFSVTGLPAGDKLVKIYEGTPYRPGEVGDVLVANLTGVTVPVGYTGSVASIAPAAEGVADVCNSRGVGGGVADGPRYAFTRVLGRQRNADVYLMGYASLQLGAHILSAANQDLLTSQIVERLAGYAIQRILLGPDSENDWSYNTFTPAQILAAYQQLIAKLQAALPSAKIYIGCTLPEQGGWGGANGLGFTQQDYYNMEKGIAAGFANVYTLDYLNAGIVASDYADASHLNESGQAKQASYTSNQFDLSDGGTGAPVLSTAQGMSLDSGTGAQTLLTVATNISGAEYQFNNGPWQASPFFVLYSSAVPSIAAGTYPVAVRQASNHANALSKQVAVAETIEPTDARNTYSSQPWNDGQAYKQFQAKPFGAGPGPLRPDSGAPTNYVRFAYNGRFELWTRQQPNVARIGFTPLSTGTRTSVAVAGGPSNFDPNIGLVYSCPAASDTMQVDGDNSADFLWGYRLQYLP